MASLASDLISLNTTVSHSPDHPPDTIQPMPTQLSQLTASSPSHFHPPPLSLPPLRPPPPFPLAQLSLSEQSEWWSYIEWTLGSCERRSFHLNHATNYISDNYDMIHVLQDALENNKVARRIYEEILRMLSGVEKSSDEVGDEPSEFEMDESGSGFERGYEVENGNGFEESITRMARSDDVEGTFLWEYRRSAEFYLVNLESLDSAWEISIAGIQEKIQAKFAQESRDSRDFREADEERERREDESRGRYVGSEGLRQKLYQSSLRPTRPKGRSWPEVKNGTDGEIWS